MILPHKGELLYIDIDSSRPSCHKTKLWRWRFKRFFHMVMVKHMKRIKEEFIEFKLLLRSIPGLITILFVTSVIAMNLLANKSIDLNVSFLALDGGIIVSWITFLTMDIITKHFGPKAANEVSLLALLVSLFFSLIFFLVSLIPGTWSQSYVDGSQGIINEALDKTFQGTWYIILGSGIAFIISAFVNNFTNYGIGLLFKKNPNSLFAFITRTYLSTMLGQFIDNLVFALLVSYFFFGWSILQCVTCALTGMLVELLCEVIFSFFGYKITKRWQKEGVGKEYFAFKERRDRK